MKLWREIEAAKVKVGEGLGVTSSRAVAQIDFMLRQACPLRARRSPSGAEAPLSRRLSEPFTLREPQGERIVEGLRMKSATILNIERFGRK